MSIVDFATVSLQKYFEAKLKRRRRRANEVVDPNSGVTIQF